MHLSAICSSVELLISEHSWSLAALAVTRIQFTNWTGNELEFELEAHLAELRDSTRAMIESESQALHQVAADPGGLKGPNLPLRFHHPEVYPDHVHQDLEA